MAATKFRIIIALLFGVLSSEILAHPMPNSLVLLNFQTQAINAELRLPLGELQAALDNKLVGTPENLIAQNAEFLKAYLLQHMKPKTNQGIPWRVKLETMWLESAENPSYGKYYELVVLAKWLPPSSAALRNFVLEYDAIVHQVVTHTILVSIRQSWNQNNNLATSAQLGVISLDIPSGTIPLLHINLDQSGIGLGFVQMLRMGMRHIAEGLDHLLFLFTLLLPATLLVEGRRWGRFGGVSYSLNRLLRIITVFTLGHSLTLIFGAIRLFPVPTQLIETLIAFSILISAIHGFRPLFKRQELWIAGCFGLIHGLAFAEGLAFLNLDSLHLALNILAFNLGIELMQLLFIALVIPWVILLSQSTLFRPFRYFAASLATIAAFAWLFERISTKPNLVSVWLENTKDQAIWLLLGLITMSLASFIFQYLGRGSSPGLFNRSASLKRGDGIPEH